MPQPARYISWTDMPAGRSLEPFVWHVAAATARAYVEAVEDDGPAGAQPPPGERSVDTVIAPPMLAALYSLRSFVPAGLELPPGGVHLRQRFEFLAPISAGDTLTTLATVEKCRPRGDKIWLTLSTRTVNQDGALVTTSQFHGVWPRESAS